VEDTSGYEKSGVRLTSLGWDDHVSVRLDARLEFVPSVLGMIH